jgi:hypothetical protein
MNQYTIAFAIGYFYGRTYGPDPDLKVRVEDAVYMNTQAFNQGLARGREDLLAIGE